MFCEKSLINRRNVCRDVSQKVEACKQFFTLEIEARILAAILAVLGMASLNDQPDEKILPAIIKRVSLAEKKIALEKICSEVINKFVLHQKTLDELKKRQEYEDWLTICNPMTPHFKCRFS